MNLRFISIVFSFSLFISCQNENRLDVPQILINSSSAIEAKESDYEYIKFIPIKLPDSLFIGEVSHIKQYNGYYFLHDEFQSKTISIINEKGEFINQLSNPGQGPGELGEVSSFTFDENQGMLYVYDRSKLNISLYDFPNLEFYDSYEIEKFLMNIERVSKDKLLIISENQISQDSYEGLAFIDLLNLDAIPLNILNNAASMEISYPNTISSTEQGILYAHPNVLTTIYEIDEIEVEPIFQIDFGQNTIEAKYWNEVEAENFERAFASEIPKATWVQNLYRTDNKIIFSYLYDDYDIRYHAAYNLNESVASIYKFLPIPNTDEFISMPIGVSNKGQIGLLYADEIDPKSITKNNQLMKAYKEVSSNDFGMILIEYQLK